MRLKIQSRTKDRILLYFNESSMRLQCDSCRVIVNQ